MLLTVSSRCWRTHVGRPPWRAPLGIPLPSRQLDDAFGFLEGAVFSAGEDPPTLESVLMSCHEPRLAEHELDTFVRRVLRLAIEQVRARQAHDCCGPSETSSVQTLRTT